jgi:O-antigen/teichoic acid export membrane protein
MTITFREKLLKKTLDLGFATALNKSAQFFFLIYLSVFKSQDEFVLYIEFALYTEILAVLLAHGANSSVLKGSLADNIHLNLTISLFFVSVLTILLALVLPLFTFKDLDELMIFILIGSPTIALNSIHKSAAISEKKLGIYSRSLRFSNMVLLIYPICDFFITTLSILDALAFLILSNLISILLIGYYPKEIVKALSFENMKNYLLSSFPFLVRNNLGSVTKNMGLFNISLSGSVNGLSGYGLINKIADQVGQLLSLLTVQFIPELRDALQNSKAKDVDQYLKIILNVVIWFLLISSSISYAIFLGISIINPKAWILDFRLESYILIFAIGIGFVKSNLATWEFLKTKHAGKIVVILEFCFLIIAYSIYSSMYSVLDTLGVSLGYLLIQIIQLAVNAFLFRFFRNKLMYKRK